MQHNMIKVNVADQKKSFAREPLIASGASLGLPVVGASQDGLARKSDLHVATHEDNASRASATHFVFAALRLSIKKDL